MERHTRGLTVYRSNRLERLVDALSEVLQEPLADPLAPECILVPGRGMAQWLSQTLAERFGVWSNVLYLYPRNFASFALERVLGKPGEALEPFEPERLFWSVCGSLRPLLSQPEFDTLARYVSRDPSGVRYFELCGRIAYTFDRYATYRPEMLQSWERRGSTGNTGPAPQLALFGKPEAAPDWQPSLWRALIERHGPLHMGAYERRFLRSLDRAKRSDNLPARISCLGLTHMPPSYTRILVALCRHLPVHMFQLSPSEAATASSAAAASSGARRRTTNPLLQSLAGLALEFEGILAAEVERQQVSMATYALYEPPRSNGRLAEVQRELLHDRAPSPTEVSAAGVLDDSIRIHVCHSPMREVEVLHDQLLALLAHDTPFEPRDVIVMMPDVETYAPLIEAVFQRTRDDAQFIPYTIADRAAQATAPVVDALERLFALGDQRLSATQILDLLTLEVVAQRFEITPQELEQMTQWLTATNVRWGIDAAHRARHRHPASNANTWRQGLERLFLGYAVENIPPRLVFDTLPAPGAEGSEALALGKLARFLDSLFRALGSLGAAHTASEWSAVVGDALEALCINDAATAWQHDELREAVTGLAARAAGAGYEEPIGSAAFAKLLFDTVNGARPARGFLMGGVTFCSMVPLRTVPFAVVCLLGFGDGQYPRREQTTDFDLMTHGPEGRRPGDRSRRSEDRYAFLEALLSARERLIITYTGQSIRDNATLPPSVLVNELLDYLASKKGADGPAPAQDYVVHHPLQAFSSRYFDRSDPRLFSHATHYLEAARTQSATASTPPAFFAEPLPTAPATGSLGLVELTRFFENPTAYLMNRRLELYLEERDHDVPDREPQELSPLDRYGVGQQLLTLLLRGVPGDEAERLIRASGALPLGSPGTIDYLSTLASAAPIAARVQGETQKGRKPPLSIELRLPSGRELIGTLVDCFGEGVLGYQFARIQARHLSSLWIRHLAYCAARGDDPASEGPLESSLIGRPEEGEGVRHVRYSRVRDARGVLDTLVRRYEQGQAAPLLLFPHTSLFYARARRKKQKPGFDLRGFVQREWEKEVAQNAHLARVYTGRPLLFTLPSPNGASFEELALEVFDPLLDHLSEVEGQT